MSGVFSGYSGNLNLLCLRQEGKVKINSNVNRVLEFPISDIATCKSSLKKIPHRSVS